MARKRLNIAKVVTQCNVSAKKKCCQRKLRKNIRLHQNRVFAANFLLSNRNIHEQKWNWAEDLFCWRSPLFQLFFLKKNIEWRTFFEITSFPKLFINWNRVNLAFYNLFCTVITNSRQIFIKNIRFAPESKLHQISIKNIRHQIARQKHQIWYKSINAGTTAKTFWTAEKLIIIPL